MANNTLISWTDHDQERYGKDPSEVVQVSQSTQNKVFRNAKAGDKIFVCSWSDFFIPEADNFRAEAWRRMKERPDLIFQVLTKRPERILSCLPEDWGDGYPNVWVGVSAENQVLLDYRLPYLNKVKAAVKFVSAEPLLSKLDFSLYHDEETGATAYDWVILGGESGNEKGKYRYRPSQLRWYKEMIQQLDFQKVAVFMKQTGTHLSKSLGLKNRHGADPSEWPHFINRQNFPNANV